MLGITVLTLLACGAATADVSGSAGGVTWGESSWVYFGARFIVISNIETDCQAVGFVDTNYDAGVAPTDADTQLLQFTFRNDAGEVQEGTFPVAATEAEVSSTIVYIQDGAFVESNANGGTLIVDAVADQATAEGRFDDITFEDGAVSGTFTAEWCRNLKP